MSKIFIRKSMIRRDTPKPVNKKRKRNKIINFRMTPEESVMLDNKIKMSGLLKQEYLAEAVLNNKVVTVGNIKSFKAIKHILFEILEKLNDDQTNAVIDEVDIYALKSVVEMINGLKREEEASE